jgi:hypothetical protein
VVQVVGKQPSCRANHGNARIEIEAWIWQAGNERGGNQGRLMALEMVDM